MTNGHFLYHRYNTFISSNNGNNMAETSSLDKAGGNVANINYTDKNNTLKKRDTLNGVWILDKTRGQPSMRGYLETMNVHELAIEANEKGDSEHDTIHDITLTNETYSIKKLSRVNDHSLTLVLNQPTVSHTSTNEPAPTQKKSNSTNGKKSGTSDGKNKKNSTNDVSSNEKGQRISKATSQHLGHVKVESSMPTLNGMARVTDTKTLEQVNGNLTLYRQELLIVNEATGKSHTTIRYFLPHTGEIGPTALTARDTNRSRNKNTSNPNNSAKTNNQSNPELNYQPQSSNQGDVVAMEE